MKRLLFVVCVFWQTIQCYQRVLLTSPFNQKQLYYFIVWEIGVWLSLIYPLILRWPSLSWSKMALNTFDINPDIWNKAVQYWCLGSLYVLVTSIRWKWVFQGTTTSLYFGFELKKILDCRQIKALSQEGFASLPSFFLIYRYAGVHVLMPDPSCSAGEVRQNCAYSIMGLKRSFHA